MACFVRHIYKSKINCHFFRTVECLSGVHNCLLFSTSHVHNTDKSAPVKYSTNKAAAMSISENIGLSTIEKDIPKYQPHIIALSTLAFLFYFCVLREENDIDEILKGNYEYEKGNELKLLNLKLKLIYCKQNGLPTDALRQKIEEIESTIKVEPIFRK